MKHEFMDFSRETRFQERLLKRIKKECFGELEDDDLSFVNAAGVVHPAGPASVEIPELQDPGNGQ